MQIFRGVSTRLNRGHVFSSSVIPCKLKLFRCNHFVSFIRPCAKFIAFDRYADAPKVVEILHGIKAALKDVPNIDLLSPFRVHLVDFAESGLKLNVVCYFATKSFDEFLYLQQVALLEVTRVVQGANATMTSVLYVDMNDPAPIGKAPLKGMVNPVPAQAVPHSGLPHSVAAPQVFARGSDTKLLDEQDAAVQINGTSGSSSGVKNKKTRGGAV